MCQILYIVVQLQFLVCCFRFNLSWMCVLEKKIALHFLYPTNSFNHESSCWLIDKDPKDLEKCTQAKWKVSVINLYARRQNTTILTIRHNERYLPSICAEENKIQLFLLKAIENMLYRLDFQLMLHKVLNIVWNSQRLWKVVVVEFWTV